VAARRRSRPAAPPAASAAAPAAVPVAGAMTAPGAAAAAGWLAQQLNLDCNEDEAMLVLTDKRSIFRKLMRLLLCRFLARQCTNHPTVDPGAPVPSAWSCSHLRFVASCRNSTRGAACALAAGCAMLAKRGWPGRWPSPKKSSAGTLASVRIHVLERYGGPQVNRSGE